MMVLTVLSISFLLMAITGYWYSRSVFSPYTICAGAWGIILLLLGLLGQDLLPVEGRFPIAITIWVSGFCAAASLAEHFTSEGKTRLEEGPATMPVILLIAILSSLGIITGTVRFALNYPGDFFLTLRSANTGLDTQIEKVLPTYGPLPYLASAMLPSYLVLLSGLGKHKGDRMYHIIFAIALIVSTLNAFVSMGKSAFFGLFFTTVLLLSLEGKIKLMPLFLSSIGLMTVFIVIQFLRETAMGELFSPRNFFNTYLFSGIVAFDSADLSVSWSGSNSLRFLHALASTAGAETEVSNTILDYTMAGKDTITNIYTVLYPFYTDFGYPGVGFFAIINGALSGFLYKKSHRRGDCKVLYAIVASYIALQFTGEFIFTNASLFIQHCIYCWAIFIPIKLKFLNRND